MPCAHARAMSATSAPNSTNSSQEVELEITAEQLQRGNQTAPESSSQELVVKHIVRQKREIEPTLPFTFHVLHWPCVFDMGFYHLHRMLKNPCAWLYYNRFVHEGYYRVYKTYEVEAFFFGQYAERMYRVELNPTLWLDEPLK